MLYLLSFAAFALAWQIAAHVIHAPLVLPTFTAVLQQLVILCRTRTFYMHLAATSARVLEAFLLSLALGAVIGFFRARFSAFRKILAFPLACVRATPVVALILVALFWFGSGTVPVFAAVIMALPVVISAISSGFSPEQDDVHLEAMSRVYGFTAHDRIRYVLFPRLKPFLLTAASASFGMAWKVVAAGEVLCLPRRALGALLHSAQVHLETQEVMAVALVIVGLSFACERGMALVLRFVFSFRREAPESSLKPQEEPCAAPETADSKSAHGITLSDITLSRAGKELYKHFSLTVAPLERTALLAASGAGKTTLLDYIAFHAENAERESATAYLFQEPRLLPHCTLLENVALPLFHLMPRKQARLKAAQALHAVGLQERMSALPAQVSGGEKQRAALARAFAFPAAVLLLDEPFQSQDARTKLSLMTLLESLLKAKPRTVLLVTHDAHEAATFCERVLVLTGSPLAVTVDEHILHTKPLSERFIRADEAQRTLEERIVASLVEP